MRYFSSLTGKQKDATINSIIILANGLEKIDKGLALQILLASEKYNRTEVENSIAGQKVFKYNNIYYPFNFKQIILNLNK